MREKSESGTTLVSVLMASVLGLAVVYGMVTSVTSATKNARSVSYLQDETNLKELLKKKISCVNTVVPKGGCLSSYQLRDKSNDIIPNPLGIFNLTASCVGNELSVEFRSSRKDPVLKTLPPWKPLYAAGMKFCAEEFTGVPPPACPAGKTIKGLNSDGTPICSDVVTASSCAPGEVGAGMNSNGTLKCIAAPKLTGKCAPGEVVVGFDATGAMICEPVSGGSAGTLVGLCAYHYNGGSCDKACLPPMNCSNKTCPDGYAWQHVAARWNGKNEVWVGMCYKL